MHFYATWKKQNVAINVIMDALHGISGRLQTLIDFLNEVSNGLMQTGNTKKRPRKNPGGSSIGRISFRHPDPFANCRMVVQEKLDQGMRVRVGQIGIA